MLQKKLKLLLNLATPEKEDELKDAFFELCDIVKKYEGEDCLNWHHTYFMTKTMLYLDVL
jgi:hypothetical protein